MVELWELIDINKVKTGVIHERGKEALIPKGMYHLVVDIWTKNSKGEILLTKRHPDKEYGLLWECSGGSVVAGENSIDGAIRELQEETGMKANKEKLFYLGDTKKSNYIVDTYLYLIDTERPMLKLQEEEVVDAIWVPIEKMAHYQERIVDGVWRRYCQFREQIETLIR